MNVKRQLILTNGQVGTVRLERTLVKTTPRLIQYREKALNAAALLAALSTVVPDRTSRTSKLADRQHVLIEELLHEFAYYARKYLEHLETAGYGVRAAADERRILSIRELVESDDETGVGDSASADWYSLTFVLGRIIHSQELVVQRGPVPVPNMDPPVFQNRAWGFLVRSDRDESSERHFVFVELLLGRFLEVTGPADCDGHERAGTARERKGA